MLVHNYIMIPTRTIFGKIWGANLADVGHLFIVQAYYSNIHGNSASHILFGKKIADVRLSTSSDFNRKVMPPQKCDQILQRVTVKPEHLRLSWNDRTILSASDFMILTVKLISKLEQ